MTAFGRADGLEPLAAPEGKLPETSTTFVGRRQELAQIHYLMGGHRLLTLTGAGGCGKTRLALEAISALGSPGTYWAELAGVVSDRAVASTVAAALGVRESPLLQASEQIARHLGAQSALVVLDNCEHVMDSARTLVEELLRRCAGLCLVTTSREPLGARDETTYRVPSLPTPPARIPRVADLLSYDSIRLFVDRARAVRPTFAPSDDMVEIIATICRRLDGIPLAIELAAARIDGMEPAAIAEGLDDRFLLLTGGARTAVPRHRTLQASVDWSYTLLGVAERVLFRRLAVFAGGFTPEAVADVADGEPAMGMTVSERLSQLVDKGLVRRDDASGTRYRLLETIRHYAQERLAEDPAESNLARHRHLLHFVALAERNHPRLHDSGVFDALELLDAEYGNLLAALSWGEQTGSLDETARLAAALQEFWYLRGRAGEGRAWLDVALSSPDLAPSTRASAVLSASRLAIAQWDMAAAEALGTQALEITRGQGDARGAAEALLDMGWACAYTARPDTAQARFDEALALAESAGDGRTLARALFGAGNMPWSAGAWPISRPLFERSLEEARRCGDVSAIIDVLHYMVMLHFHAGRDAEAETSAREGLGLAELLNDSTHVSQFTSFLSSLRTRQGNLAEAVVLLDKATVFAERSGSPFPQAFRLTAYSFLLRAQADLSAAAQIFEEIGTTGEAFGIVVPAVLGYSHAAEIAVLAGDLPRAEKMAAAAARIRAGAGGPVAGASWAEALVAFAENDFERAEERCHAALADAIESDSIPYALEIIEAMGCVAVAAGGYEEGGRLLGATSATWGAKGWMRPRTLVPRFESAVAGGRSSPDAAVFDRAFREGESITLDDAIAYARRGRGDRKRPTAGWPSLTPTELRVVALVAEGLSNVEVGKRLFVSRATVKAHLGHIFPKLGVTSRSELAAAAARRGI